MKYNVLIIDDDHLIPDILEQYLDNVTHHVIKASSGEEGLALLKELPVDLILSDIRMPGLSGEDVLTHVREHHPEIPVILLTAHASVHSAVKAIKKGAFDYIVKPVEQEDFQAAVRRGIEHLQLRRENAFYRSRLSGSGLHGTKIIGNHPSIKEAEQLINQASRSDVPVLIVGEAGTGKRLVAETLHFKSLRAAYPLVVVNCPMLHSERAEAEIFGIEKTASSGKTSLQPGYLQLAERGSLLFHLVNEAPSPGQSHLLKLCRGLKEQPATINLPDQSLPRLISTSAIPLTPGATDCPVDYELLYLINTLVIHLPALRDRVEDIPLLTDFYLSIYGQMYLTTPKQISQDALDKLCAYNWPGNIRELQQVLERAAILKNGDLIDADDIQFAITRTQTPPSESTDFVLQSAIDRATCDHVLQVLEHTNWHKQKAAKLMGVDRVTLYRILKKYSLEKST